MSVAQEYKYTNPSHFVKTSGLQIRPYEGKLYSDSKQKCAEFMKANSLSNLDETRCIFEVYSAFDCIRREKVQKSGRFNDPLRLCKYQINFMNYNLKREYGEEVSMALLEEDMKKMKKERKPYV